MVRTARTVGAVGEGLNAFHSIRWTSIFVGRRVEFYGVYLGQIDILGVYLTKGGLKPMMIYPESQLDWAVRCLGITKVHFAACL